MNIESVKSLFKMFSGEDNVDEYEPLIGLALAETEKLLLPQADRSDIRLSFLCAAMANHRLCQIRAARDKTQAAYSGTMLTDSTKRIVENSEKLLRDYLELCSDIITPQMFTFVGI